jgi:glycolate oxidase
MLELMEVEVKTAMGLMGVTSLAQLDPSWVRPALPVGPGSITSAYPVFEEQRF